MAPSSSITYSSNRKLPLFFNVSFLFLLSSISLKTLVYPSPYSNSLDGTPTSSFINHPLTLYGIPTNACSGLHKYADYESKCLYIKKHVSCRSKGYINYLQIFYCNFGQSPILAHVLLLLWLLVLFYLLGNTASTYFCSSLESLSKILNIPPTLAGVTLLSLGNGAPDVFASIVSFTRSSDGDVALNSILGGAFFVSSTVIGIISVLIGPNQIKVDKASFIRDVLFLFFSLLSLLIIILTGKINLWGSIFFLSIYVFYVCAVSATHIIIQRSEIKEAHISVSSISHNTLVNSHHDLAESGGIPLLGCVDEGKQSNWPIEKMVGYESFHCNYLDKVLYVLELPLYLPRRVTIPDVNEKRWSKPYAVISVTLAPVLVAALCNTQRENVGSRTALITYMTAGLIGIVFGNMAYVTTNNSSPPTKCSFPWLAGGFAMSVTWTYVIAEELVSLLISGGNIIGVGPSVLGLTVLAWGNSLGDLIANTAMAMKGGADGAQIAISGCYAGPLFNTLMGLGFPLVLSAWSEYPNPYLIPEDHSLYETLGFLMGGLLWALVILPQNNMRMDRTLGLGLLTIYLCFLFLRIARTTGILRF